MGALTLHTLAQGKERPPQARGLQVHKRHMTGKPVPRRTVTAPGDQGGGKTVARKGAGEIN